VVERQRKIDVAIGSKEISVKTNEQSPRHSVSLWKGEFHLHTLSTSWLIAFEIISPTECVMHHPRNASQTAWLLMGESLKAEIPRRELASVRTLKRGNENFIRSDNDRLRMSSRCKRDFQCSFSLAHDEFTLRNSHRTLKLLFQPLFCHAQCNNFQFHVARYALTKCSLFDQDVYA
jgi:hypothetical protein